MNDTIWWVIEILSGLAVLAVLSIMWRYHHPGPDRRIWRCVRYQGGGVLVSPRRMSLEEVTQWLAESANVEVAHVDENYGFVFYRPRGG
jgi:hypothetical protein